MVQHDGKVGERRVLDGDAQGDPVQPPLELGDDQCGGAGGSGGGGDDVDGRGAGAAEVLVWVVEQDLVAGVGVHGGHEPPLDPEGVMQDLDHRDPQLVVQDAAEITSWASGS